uniref:Cilia- and flagella-associated protein 299 n=1 Tax=Laticauda laticaudata TaxID=8630 RepID=A0A8C5WQK7_LATLA
MGQGCTPLDILQQSKNKNVMLHLWEISDADSLSSNRRRATPSKGSFYNWDRNLCCLNSSPNYQVIAENACGLLFKNKSDRKIINVDPKAFPGDNTTRIPIKTDLYLQVVIYDHVLRRKI